MDDIEPEPRDLTHELLYGDVKEAEITTVYERYAMGDPVSVIATAMNVSPAAILSMMRTRPEQYEVTKQKREAFMGLRLQRSVSLVDAMNLKTLEEWREGTRTPTIDELKAMDKWIKHAADRLALHEGKPTQSVRIDMSETLEEIEAWTKKVRAAGNGLNLSD